MHLSIDQLEQSASSDSLIQSAVCSDSGEVFAHIVNASVGADPHWLDACPGICKPGGRVVVRCGDPIRAEDDSARLLASWSQAGWARFDEDVARLDELVHGAGLELLIRPSCSGMLSDAICTAAWARRSGDLGCKLMLDPAGWLVGSMMRDVSDHLSRIADLCQECIQTTEKVGAVLIRSVKTDESGALVECSIGEGDIDPELIADRLGTLIGSGLAMIVLDRGDLGLLGL